MLQLKILHATTKISHAATKTQCSQINKFKINTKKRTLPGELWAPGEQGNLRNEAESQGHPGANLTCSLKEIEVSLPLDS